MTVETKSPAVIKLYGEHAVVYGKPAIAAAISMFASSSVDESPDGKLHVILSDLNRHFEISADQLSKLYEQYSNRVGMQYYAASASKIVSKEALPFATIASIISSAYNAELGMSVKVHSEIPMQRGLASSAACSTAFALSLLKFSGIRLSDSDAIEIARAGEKVSHMSEGAGKIDVNTSYYGGYVSSISGSFKVEDVSSGIEVVIIDTGPKKSTAETVGRVRQLYNENKAVAEEYFDRIDRISTEGLLALKSGNLRRAGQLMTENHELLGKLGVSSEALDSAVSIAVRDGAYGAKLSGGGGGGIAIALAENPDALVMRMRSDGIAAYKVRITSRGAKRYYNSKLVNSF